VEKDYNLLVLGSSGESGGTMHVFTPLVDNVVRLAPWPRTSRMR
jgi:hypothetical protein